MEPRAWGSWGARPTRVLEAVSIGRGWACEGGNVDPGWPAYSLAKRECRTGEWEGAGLALRCPRRGLLRPVSLGSRHLTELLLVEASFPLTSHWLVPTQGDQVPGPVPAVGMLG